MFFVCMGKVTPSESLWDLRSPSDQERESLAGECALGKITDPTYSLSGGTRRTLCQTFYIGSQRFELVVDSLVTTVEMVDTVNDCIPFRYQTRKH